MSEQEKSCVSYDKIDRAFDALAVMLYVFESLSREELLEMRGMLKTVRERREQHG